MGKMLVPIISLVFGIAITDTSPLALHQCQFAVVDFGIFSEVIGVNPKGERVKWTVEPEFRILLVTLRVQKPKGTELIVTNKDVVIEFESPTFGIMRTGANAIGIYDEKPILGEAPIIIELSSTRLNQKAEDPDTFYLCFGFPIALQASKFRLWILLPSDQIFEVKPRSEGSSRMEAVARTEKVRFFLEPPPSVFVICALHLFWLIKIYNA